MLRIHFLVSCALKLGAAWFAIALSYCVALGQGNASTVIRGTVLNARAEPVPHARIDISTAAPITGPALFCPSCYLDCQKWTTTDRTGHFSIVDLNSRLKFRLVLSAAGYKTQQTEHIAPGEKLHEFKLRERPRPANLQRVVQGFVKNDQGIAVQGALVSPVATIDQRGLRTSSAEAVSSDVTDATGRFEIELVDGLSGIDVEITAEGLCITRFIGLSPKADRKEFVLSEGAHIIGRVERHGHPASGLTISVAQTDRANRGDRFFLKAIPAVTDQQGRFELKNLPPDQEYCVFSVIGETDRIHSAAVLKTHKFAAPSSGQTLDLGSLATVQPVSFGGRVIASAETPVENLFLLFNRDPAWDLIKVPIEKDGAFQVDGLPPEVYEIRLSASQFELDADKIDALLWTEKSIKRLIDEPSDTISLPIRPLERSDLDLQPNGTQKLAGRVIMKGDKGAVGIRVDASDSVQALGKGLGNGEAPWTTTSEDGRFTLAELPETRVWIKLYRPESDGMRFRYLGMVKPRLNDTHITIRLGPDTAYEQETRAGRIK